MTVCGTGSWTGPKPGDPDNNVVLSAVGTYGAIRLSWTWPATNPAAVAHVQVYRGTSNVLANAALLTFTNTDRYLDTDVTVGVEYWYWIQIVSTNGTIGAAIGPASAIPLPDIDRMIQILTGQIDAGLLAQTLRNEVDKIPTTKAELDAEIAERIEQNDITAISVSATQDAADQAIAYVAAETVARTSAYSALAQQIDSVGVALGGDIAFAEQNLSAGISAVDGKVMSMYTVRLTVNGLVGGFGIYNNGASVEAGFDVDTFWIGRTNADKRKPFIISGGVVYIDNGTIRNLNATNITVDYLSAIQANIGEITAGSITLNNGTWGSWSKIRTPGKDWGDGKNGFVLAGYLNESYYYEFQAGGNSLRMSAGPSIGTYAAISFGYGKFTADHNGTVVADNVDIRRRVVLQNGTLDPTDVIEGTHYSQVWVPSGDSGYWQNITDVDPVGTVYTGRMRQVVLTDIYDANVQNLYNNQPYYVACYFDGSVFRDWNGAASNFQLHLSGECMALRSYSNTGVWSNDYRLAIVFDYTVKLTAGSFIGFRLPTATWTLFKL